MKEPASQAFTPTVFKPFAIELTGGSGIGHEVFQGDQEQVARRRCVRVFFSEYQILVGRSAPFEVVDNVGPVRRDRKCVVFRTV